MAAQKTRQKSSRPATKKPASSAKGRGRSGGAKKEPAKRGGTKSNTRPKTAAQAQQLEAKMKARNQTFAVILFAVAILLFFLVFIEGKNVWLFLHNGMLGLFGTSAILWPILITYISIVTALERPKNTVSTKIWLTVLIILLFCSSNYIFSYTAQEQTNTYFEQLGVLYAQGVDRVGSGLFSGILGIPIYAALGDAGAKIVILLLLFVAIMILTGTSLIQLFRAVTKPVDTVKNSIEASKAHIRERRLEEEKLRSLDSIDIPLDENSLPAHPVRSSGKVAISNEKREHLEQVFSAPDPELNLEGLGALKETPAEKVPAKPEKEEKKSSDSGAAAAAAAFAARRKSLMSKSDPAQKQPDPQTVPIQIPSPQQDLPPDGYYYPPLSLLSPSDDVIDADSTDELRLSGEMLVDTLKSFGVQTKIIDISRGPAVTRFELQPAAGVKISKITNLSDDIALNLAASGVRIEAPIPGKAAVGIEIPNKNVSIVRMRELIDSAAFNAAKSRLTVALGRDIAGSVTVADLSKMPHILIAGSTGSGKSVCINSLIISLLYKATPNEVRFLMVDPKVVELGIYNGIPHLLVPVVTDPRKAAGALNWAVNEMLNRYKIFAEHNVRDLQAYNRLVAQRQKDEPKPEEEAGEKPQPMPQIVIIIDELADLMMAAPNEVEDSICRLAQMARAAGMHLVIATQRPSVDVITGIIKANIPSRIAFAVSSQVDSRTILDMGGAEKLLGRGDMLFSPVGSPKPIRIQGCFVSDSEIEAVVNYIKKTQETGYDQSVIEEIEKNAVVEQDKGAKNDDAGNEDPMLREAVKCVVEAGQASTSLLQRRLRLGYARAGRLIDEMEQMGIVGPHEGSKPRQVLITYQQWLEMNMQQSDNEGE